MTSPTKNLRRPRPGTSVLKVAREVDDELKIDRAPELTPIPAAIPGEVFYFLFAQHPPEVDNMDFIEAIQWFGVDPAPSAPGELIALEPLLRRTNYDGMTFNGITYTYTSNFERDADTGAEVIQETITPPFAIGELLTAFAVGDAYALRNNPGGGTQRIQFQMFGSGRVWASDEPASSGGT